MNHANYDHHYHHFLSSTPCFHLSFLLTGEIDAILVAHLSPGSRVGEPFLVTFVLHQAIRTLDESSNFNKNGSRRNEEEMKFSFRFLDATHLSSERTNE